MSEASTNAAGLLDPAAAAAFTADLQTFADNLSANFAVGGQVKGQPEDQLKPVVSALVAAAGTALGLPVVTRTEVRVAGVTGRPDLGIAVGGLLTGNIELKAPGKGADAHLFPNKRDRDQFERFSALPNLAYTDGRVWTLYASGAQTSRVELPFDPTQPGAVVDGTAAAALLNLLAALLRWRPVVPTGPRALAQMVAPLTRYLRDEVLADVRSGGTLAQLASEWRKVFYPEADDPTFADAYAQTLTYALLLGKLEGAASPVTAEAAAHVLDDDHALLAQVLRVLAQKDARKAIGMPVELLERVMDAVDPVALSKAGQRDPWLFFYEDFLAAYDPRQRNNRGVYFTPLPVVGAQVRLAEWLLNHRFGLQDAFAAEGVTVLDPATGTGTYPLDIVTRALEQAEAELGPGALGEVATRLAHKVHAFELLVGPYAVAHLRLAKVLRDAGATLPNTGVHVYLTDALAAPVAAGFAAQAPLFEQQLAAEQERASKVKANTRVMVCMGNPPYDRDESQTGHSVRRKGSMVRYDATDPSKPGLITDYVQPLSEAGKGAYAKSLYNDYVYFWRWASWKVFETTDGPGLVSLITASSYLNGEAFAGLRQHLREVADELWVLDLGGEGRGTRQDDNVFDILTPVCITIAVRHQDTSDRATPAAVHYRRLEGTRADKYTALDELTELLDADWEPGPAGWTAPLVPEATGEFAEWPAIDTLFPWRDTGSHFYRSWPIAETKQLAEQRWQRLVTSGSVERPLLLKESRDRKADKSYRDLLTSTKLPPIAALRAGDEPAAIRRYGFRTLDRHWCILDSRVGDYLRPQLWAVASPNQVYLQTLIMSPLGRGPAASAFADVPDCHAYRGRGDKGVMPLWRDADATHPNVTPGLLEHLSQLYGTTVAAPDLLAYVYGLLGTGAYSARFASELAVPPPRIPLTAVPDTFEAVRAIGAELLWWHTYGERFQPVDDNGRPVSKLPRGSARSLKAVVGLPDDYAYDEATQTLRIGTGEVGPVPAAVWTFEVSGLRIVQSWLGYRMKRRAGRSSSPLDELRPNGWEATAELLTLLDIVAHTVEREQQAAKLLDELLAGTLLKAADLPQPSDSDRRPPEVALSEAGQARLFE